MSHPVLRKQHITNPTVLEKRQKEKKDLFWSSEINT